MRKFDFDNLGLLSSQYDVLEQLWIDALTAPSVDLTLFAPQPGPLFMTTNLTNGDDTYTSTDGEVVNGLDGNDTLRAGGFTSTLNGDGGDDILDDRSRDQTTLNGGTGADTITLYAAQSVANGGADNDTIYINDDASEAHGDAGDDFITAGLWSASFMTLDGGTGIDTLVLYYSDFEDTSGQNRYGGTLDMTTGMGSGDYNVTVSGFESLHFVGGGYSDSVTGTGGDDIISDGGFYSFFGPVSFFAYGLGGDDFIYGMAGDDIIIGRGGIDVLDGGDGNDTITSGADYVSGYEDPNENEYVQNHEDSEATINGGAGNDTIISFGNDTIDAGSGDDVVIMGRSERDTATMTEGGAGIDEINFSNLDPAEGGGEANSLLVVDLQGQAYSLRNTDTNTVLFVDTFGVFENATGSEYRDVLQGDGLNNVLRGLDGDDNLQGRAGDDVLEGGMGLDSLDGGDGVDTAVYSSANVDDYDFVETAAGEYTVTMLNGNTDGSDTLVGIEIVRLGGINGTDYDITTLANTGIMLDGTSGNDTLNGTPGDDILNGLGGADIFNGFAGNDLFIADFSDLEFNGGEGYDTIRFDFGVDGSGDSTFLIDFRDYDFDSIEEITLNPTLVGGGAGSATYFFEFGASQFDQLIKFDFLVEGDLQIFNDGVSSLDLTDFDSPVYSGSFAVYGGGTSGETFTLTIDQDPVEFIGFGNDDIIISLHDPNVRWSFRAFGDTNSTSIDTVDFSQMLTVDDGNGGTIGLMTFDLSTGLIIQSGFGLSSDSSARVFDFDVFIGWDGDDVFITNGNDNSFIGNAGDNTAVYSSSDVLDYAVNEIAPGQYTIEAIGGTGEGIDTLTDVQTVRLGGINGTDYDIDYLLSISPIDLTNGDDVYVGTADDNIVNGLDGNDIISGEDGNDTLNGDGGNDILRGGNGDDILNGGEGDDILFGENGSDMFDGGAGSDTVSYDNFFDEITIDLLTGTASDGALGDSFVSIENITGSAFRNILRGDSGDNVFTGGDLSDTLQGRNGNDTLIGGFGDDTLDGGRGEDVLFGQEGDDTLNGRQGTEADDDYAVYFSTDPADYIVTYLGGITYSVQSIGTGEGTDTLTSIEFIRLGGLNGVDYDISMFPTGNGEIDLTNGDDNYTGTAADEIINGLDGNDIIDGGTGNNTLNGDGGDDTLISLGNDILSGGAGNDIVEMGGNVFDAATTTDGGADIDTISFSTLAQFPSGNLFLVLDLQGQAYSVRDGSTVLYLDSFMNFENATGSEFRDLLQGDAGNNVLMGLGGDDTLQGRAGDDTLMGGTGDNSLDGGDGNDLIISEGNDIIMGGAGDDIVDISAGVLDSSTAIDGGAGIDMLTLAQYAGSATAVNFVVIDLQSQSFSIRENGAIIHAETFSGFENATGTSFTDLLQGDNDDNVLIGLEGDDTLEGRGGSDVIDGGLGFDIASYANSSSAIVFDGLGLVAASGDIADDTLINIEAIRGTAFNDRFFGDNDASVFYGGAGADRLFGRNGDDELYGEDGNDIILAGRDNDVLDGGAGNDQLRGNEGDDTIFGGDGNDAIAGGAGADAMDGGAGIDRAEYTYGTNAGVTASLGDSSINTGDAAGDTYIDIENLYGTSFADTLYGDAEDNRIDGRLGDDMLFGGDGNDYLLGGAGDDVINGEGGNDLLFGQAGMDIYQFDAAHGTDRIVVFTQGEDLIEFTESVFDFSDLTITQDGAAVNIDTGEGMIIVNNSLVADFAADDFIFASPPSQEPLDMSEQDIAMYVDVDALI